MTSANIALPKISKMTINFELFKVSKVTSLKIYIYSVTEKLETSKLVAVKPHSKDSTRYSALGSCDIIIS